MWIFRDWRDDGFLSLARYYTGVDGLIEELG